MTVRTRFAPSPTGSLHVGGARTALYCWLYARRHDGRFLLRIEDTDQVRSTDEAAAGILRDLRWLGITWDEGPGTPDPGTGPFFQAQRLALYDAQLARLQAADRAYEAWDSPAELEALRATATEAKENFRYRRHAVGPDQVARYRAEGRTPVLRFAMPERAITLHDAILGEVTLGAEDLDDLVVRKADGFPTYHLAVVVDDHLMGVSLVLRGQEHLMNTHKHLGLYEALGWDPPTHGHLPLIFNPAGAKMSKRDKAKVARQAGRDAAKASGAQGWGWLAEAAGRPLDEVEGFMTRQHDGVPTAEAIARVLHVELPMIEVMDFRRAGYLPEALLNYLALLGWSPGDDREILTVDELVASFDLERVNKTAARFDPDKLAWVNATWIKSSSLDRLLDAQEAYLEVAPASPFHGVDRARRRAFLALYQPRITTLADLDAQARFFFVRPTTWEEAAVNKHLRKGGGLQTLPGLASLLAGAGSWDAASLAATLEGWATAQGLGMGKVAQPLRVALTGTSVSPGIGETLELLGREEVLARIDRCIQAL